MHISNAVSLTPVLLYCPSTEIKIQAITLCLCHILQQLLDFVVNAGDSILFFFMLVNDTRRAVIARQEP